MPVLPIFFLFVLLACRFTSLCCLLFAVCFALLSSHRCFLKDHVVCQAGVDVPFVASISFSRWYCEQDLLVCIHRTNGSDSTSSAASSIHRAAGQPSHSSSSSTLSTPLPNIPSTSSSTKPSASIPRHRHHRSVSSHSFAATTTGPAVSSSSSSSFDSLLPSSAPATMSAIEGKFGSAFVCCWLRPYRRDVICDCRHCKQHCTLVYKKLTRLLLISHVN